MTRTQLRFLRAVEEGRVHWSHHMGSPQKGGLRVRGEKGLGMATYKVLLARGLIAKVPAGFGSTFTPIVLTDAGRAALDPKGER